MPAGFMGLRALKSWQFARCGECSVGSQGAERKDGHFQADGWKEQQKR